MGCRSGGPGRGRVRVKHERTFGKRGARRMAIRGIGAALIGGLALLLWARLKLVTDTPRMVYADPPASSAEPSGGQPPAGQASVGADRE